jgi:hypothetical protein
MRIHKYHILLYTLLIIQVIYLISFMTITCLRLYGHDVGIQIYPAHKWFLKTLQEGDFPYWFNSPRYTFPTLTIQFGQWFVSPYILLLYLLDISYSWYGLRYEFLFWRLIAFLSLYIYSTLFTPRRGMRVISSLLYISTGMYAANDGEHVFLVTHSLLPWFLYSLSTYSTNATTKSAIHLSLSLSSLLWFGYHGALLTIPMLYFPYAIHFLVNIYRKTFHRGRAVSSALFVIFLTASLTSIKFLETFTFPLFGTSLGPQRSSLEGLYHPYALLSLVLPNPFYLPHLNTNFSNSLFVGPIPFFISLVTAMFLTCSYVLHPAVQLYFRFFPEYYFTQPFSSVLSVTQATRHRAAIIIIPMIFLFDDIYILLALLIFITFLLLLQIYNSLSLLQASVFSHSLWSSNSLRHLLLLFLSSVMAIISGVDFAFTQNIHRFFLSPQYTRWQYINCDVLVIFMCICTVSVLSRLNVHHISSLFNSEIITYIRYVIPMIFILPLISYMNDTAGLSDRLMIGIPSIISFLTICIIESIILFPVFYSIVQSTILNTRAFIIIITISLIATGIAHATVNIILTPTTNKEIHNLISVPFMGYFLLDSLPVLEMLAVAYLVYRHRTFCMSNLNYSVYIILFTILFSAVKSTPFYLSHLEMGSVYYENNLVDTAPTPLHRIDSPVYDTNGYTIHSTVPAMWAIANTVPQSRSIDDAKSPNSSIFRNILLLAPSVGLSNNSNELSFQISQLVEPSLFTCSDGIAPTLTNFALKGNTLHVLINTTCPLTLVITDTWSTGWRTYVNNYPSHTLKINSSLRGVQIYSGINEIFQEYQPPGSPYAQYLLLFTLFFCVVVLIAQPFTRQTDLVPYLRSIRAFFN